MELASIVEAIIIASNDPISTDEVARLIRSRVAEVEDQHAREIEEIGQSEAKEDWLMKFEVTNADEVNTAIMLLNESYLKNGRAFQLIERGKGWRLCTLPAFGDFVRQMFPGRKPERLSGPAMETLAIVAYRQPITKAAIEAVRGVSCDGMLQKLLDRDLVKIGGRSELPGRPLLYETTDLFYEHFGIRNIDDLPNSGELRRVRLPDKNFKDESKEEQLPLVSVDHDSI
jgi:segregation and condensation protein B